MSPEAARKTVDEMNRIAKQLREDAVRTDFALRYKSIIAAEHAEAVAAEYAEEIR